MPGFRNLESGPGAKINLGNRMAAHIFATEWLPI